MQEYESEGPGSPGSPAEVSPQTGLVSVREFKAPRFTLENDTNDFLKYLDEHGYAVVAGVASEEDIKKARALLWDYLEAVPGTLVRRDDIGSWGWSRDWIPNPDNGILNGYGFGQSAFMWHLRMLPRVKEAFAAIWETNDLLVSFDGGNIFRPWRYNPKWLTRGGWFHVDQNAQLGAQSSGRVCVQGLVTLRCADRETGGLVVVPGSHRRHEDLCRNSKFARRTGDFVPVSLDDPILQEGAILVAAEAGDLILWDSRTVHCNTPALTASEVDMQMVPHKTKRKDWQLIREVGYVCMTPRSWSTSEIRSLRQKAFVNNLSASHWPHKMVVAGYPLPGTPSNDPESISQEQRSLIGYPPDDPPRGYCCVQ